MDHHHSELVAGGIPHALPVALVTEARLLVEAGHVGALGTLSRQRINHPFVSFTHYATDVCGRPLFLLSDLALHTRNLDADPHASLLISEQDTGDALDLGRITLMGQAVRLNGLERTTARRAYVARHPAFASCVALPDFSIWRLDIENLYYIAGSGAMAWLPPEWYEAIGP